MSDAIAGLAILIGIAAAIVFAIIGIIVGIGYLLGLGWNLAEGYEYEEKTVTVNITKGEFVGLFFGNDEKPTVVINKWDMDKRQLDEIPNFIEAFIKDRVQRSYKVEIP